MDFTGKTVLVTGASRGIGRAVALAFKELGATVIGTATSESGAEAVSAVLAGSGKGMVLNVGDPASCEACIKAVTEELAKDSPLQMELSARRDGDQIAITVKETALSSDVNGKVQVWVLEDSIQAVQFMPDGSRDREYIHNHVLRKEVNGMWGEEVKIALSDTEEQTYEQGIDAAWNVAHLSIVAFVYNQEGVVQVVKSKVE